AGLADGKPPEPNKRSCGMGPGPGGRRGMYKKQPQSDGLEPADLEVLFEREPGADPEPYERLLEDALRGDHTLFTRQDAIEETWRVVQPLLDEPGPVHPYEPGTWGPKEADKLLRGIATWSEPWMPGK